METEQNHRPVSLQEACKYDCFFCADRENLDDEIILEVFCNHKECPYKDYFKDRQR